MWVDNGRPKTGIVFDIMRSTRAEYHAAIKQLKRQKNQNRRQKFAETVLNDSHRKFWDEINKMDSSVKNIASSVDGVSNVSAIVEIFARKYTDLFQCNATSKEEMYSLENHIAQCINIENSRQFYEVHVQDVREAFSKLNCNKNDGCGRTNSNHSYMYQTSLYVCSLC